jgi:DNA polymerase-3 subunit beta
MQLTLLREELLKPLQFISGVVEKRQTLPILSNALLKVQAQQLSIIGTDLEVELIGRIGLSEPAQPGEITVSARKLMDICRCLPEKTLISLKLDDARLQIQAGRSRFTLATLPGFDFPALESGPSTLELSIEQGKLRRLLECTAFAMAQQDVRYYLNGVMFAIKPRQIHTVATDGHRLALVSLQDERIAGEAQAIVPRKAVLELLRLLPDNSEVITLALGSTYIRLVSADFTFTSKLIDGRYPDYERLIPKDGDKCLLLNREGFKQTLLRVAILANEKNRGIRLQLSPGKLQIVAQNAEQEQAEEEMGVVYKGDVLDIGFNVSYLLDVLNTLPGMEVKLTLGNANSSLLMEAGDGAQGLYVIMPMRL